MKKIKVKEKLKKLVIILMALITIGFSMPAKSQATIITNFIDLLMHIPDGGMHLIDKLVAGSDEFTWEELNFKSSYGIGNLYNFIVTPYEIFTSGTYEDNGTTKYTKLGLLDINFFSDKEITSDTKVSSQILGPVIGNIYIGLRNLALVLMMLVVLYIGIKIMISSIAAQQAKYKQLLVDWLVGFALLFMMHYIMSGIVSLNSIVVSLLSNDEGDSYYVGVAEIKDEGGVTSSDSTWFDIMWLKKGSTLSGKKYEEFKKNRVIIRNSDREDGTFSSVGNSNKNYIEKDGRLDLDSVPKGSQFGNVSTWSKGYLGYYDSTAATASRMGEKR